MANPEHLAILHQGVCRWNAWRKANPQVRPDLSRAVLSESSFQSINLYRANLWSARINGADLSWSTLAEANLTEADFSGADLSHAVLMKANLQNAIGRWGKTRSKSHRSRCRLNGCDGEQVQRVAAPKAKVQTFGHQLFARGKPRGRKPRGRKTQRNRS